MTYRHKIGAVMLFSGLVVLMAAALSIWSVKATDRNILQANLANKLLTEHQQLSVNAYRLFKQLTDEILLGSAANQSVVRNKRQAIQRSLALIRQLELEQREALGSDFAPNAVEDTDELESLIDTILSDFQSATELSAGPQRSLRVNAILEERIDVGFRDRVNVALERQRGVVSRLNAEIHRVHSQSVGIAIGLVITTLFGGLAMGLLLVRGIASPLETLRRAAETWRSEGFGHRIPASADAEFDEITQTFNAMAERLSEVAQQRERTEAELQAAVAARTEELSRANQALQRSDSVRREFFADVSHELRTPLTVIRGEAQVALRGSERTPQEYREILGIVHEQAVGLSRLVDDMLFVARTDAERLRLSLQHVRLPELMQSVVREVEGMAEAREVRVSTDLAAAPAELIVDPDRIRQLLIILLDNAIRYSPAGGEVVVRSEAGEGLVTVSVSDCGPGIDAQDLPHIFDRFFRGSAGQGDGSHGLGLGLAVAKAIVTAHRGQIRGLSEPGQGTTILFELPTSPE